MPRGNKTSLIQKLASQASLAFKDVNESNIGDNKDLIALLNQVSAADLNIAPRCNPSRSKSTPKPTVTYMHICETPSFSMGVFLLDSGATIPLHDHPGMHGMLKVLYGQVSIRCFDKLDKVPDQAESQTQFVPPLQLLQKESLWRAALRGRVWYSEDSGPCLLTPQRENLHQIDAVDGPAAFFDILAPPYDPDDGRDCHYYKVLQTVPGAVRKDEPPSEEERWLLEIPQPDDFWCGGEPYPGPKVSL
ncbi:hypothetical protein DPEC_G00032120 [Dallia pectoralis]|uniref:Uncharacterized protein n=1 Tax=Dallia pectoralis TaxID=75939 RepID=A0ACC2HCH2_DALPE|nr:hypothetical protein DPEC_G00032120 [Dallia pectoralis]